VVTFKYGVELVELLDGLRLFLNSRGNEVPEVSDLEPSLLVCIDLELLMAWDLQEHFC
jgi:hypothetical protein